MSGHRAVVDQSLTTDLCQSLLGALEAIVVVRPQALVAGVELQARRAICDGVAVGRRQLLLQRIEYPDCNRIRTSKL